jgi:hypothetical protein
MMLLLPRALGNKMKLKELHRFIYQGLETELGCIYVYQTAIHCAVLSELGEWWRAQLGRAQRRADLLRDLCVRLDLNPDVESTARQIVRYKAQTMVLTMELSQKFAAKEGSQIVAAESVFEIERKVLLNWELLGAAVKHTIGDTRTALELAYLEYESGDKWLRGFFNWPKELSLQALGLPSHAPRQPEVRVLSRVSRASLQAEISDEDVAGTNTLDILGEPIFGVSAKG